MAREQHLLRHALSINAFKKNFLDSIEKPDSQIFTDDLRNMIISADNDEEINGVIQALKKYNANKLKLTDYHFGSPIMRLLYIQNRLDLAMELYTDESLNDVFRDSGSALILLNKLIEDKRYADAIKMFEHGMGRGFSTASGRTYPTDVVTLAMEALYRQNTKESLAKAKELILKIMKHDADVNPRTAAMLALLSIQHDESPFALEILSTVRAKNLTTIQNIRAVCYAEMGRVEEAISLVHILADQPPIDNDRRRVFPLVLQHIGKAVEKLNNDDVKTRFDDLSKFISQNNRLSSIDLFDFLSQPITRRHGFVNSSPRTQQFSRTSFQRTSGVSRDTDFRDDYYQKSGQRPIGNKYIRDNEYQSPRFGSDNYLNSERRSNSISNENDRLSNRQQRPSLNKNNFDQENLFQRSDSSTNRNHSTTSAHSSGREGERNVLKRTDAKSGPMQTTSTSPIPQPSTNQ